MDTIIEKLQAHRKEQHDAAERVYSEILQRFDNPQDGDAEKLDGAMRQLRIEIHELEHDIHLVQRYREYLAESRKPGDAGRQAKFDAENIRKGHKRLFMTVKG
jgi:hypothetical protein